MFLATYSLPQILPYIGRNKPPLILNTKHGRFKIEVATERYECFKRSLVCVGCQVIGNMFVLERYQHDPQQSIHLIPYHQREDGRIMKLTVDHKIPRSQGGQYKQNNLSTMCEPCNNLKDNKVYNQSGYRNSRWKTLPPNL